MKLWFQRFCATVLVYSEVTGAAAFDITEGDQPTVFTGLEVLRVDRVWDR